MVAFTKAELPNTITSVEGVLLWASSVLQTNHAGETYKENELSTGRYEKAFMTSFPSVDSGLIAVSRCAIKLPSNVQAIEGKGWEPNKLIQWADGTSIPADHTS